jgi:hypothetical protein
MIFPMAMQTTSASPSQQIPTNEIRLTIAHPGTENSGKKTDVNEPLRGFVHVGLLSNGSPGDRPGLPLN